MSDRLSTEAERLEALWGGEFGDAYIERNRSAATHRRAFWEAQLAARPVRSVLEVGCNTGVNLRWLVGGGRTVCGVDVNEHALAEMKSLVPATVALRAAARRLPFRGGCFDIVFTMGVLIHQPTEALEEVMAEIERCSNRYVLCAEYFAETATEVPYRGQSGALFKRDFGRIYQEMFPRLQQIERGYLAKADGWDDVTYWVFEK